MALNIDEKFKRGVDGTGRSKPRASFVKVLAAPPPAEEETLHNFTGEEAVEDEEIAVPWKEKRGLLDIDLNALPQGDYPTTKKAVTDQQRPPTAASSFASNSREGKVNFAGISEEVLEEDKERRERCWPALLGAAEVALREYEENLRTCWDSVKGWTKKTGGDGRLNTGGACSYDAEVVAAAQPVVRSKRGRAVALPNKYRDSFLGAAVEAEYPWQSRSGKSGAAIAAPNRKSRQQVNAGK